jgi:5-(carboxyamino)imidazole ribonucleotide mutase
MKSRRKQASAEISLIMGSDSDWPVVEPTVNTLYGFGLRCETHVISAHRTPELAAQFAAGAARRGIKVLIAAAGGAAHLAGTLAANTTLPVIGIPLKVGTLDGLDALLATAQMPAGVPVATVALGSAGPVNAAILAAQIVAVNRPELAKRLRAHKNAMKLKVKEGDRKVKSRMEKTYA